MAILVLEETGLLPHLNPGVMSWEEMNRLKPVAPRMGMMLETTSRRLFEEQGQAHYKIPGQGSGGTPAGAEDAGRLNDPVHDGAPDRDRRDHSRSGRRHLRAAPDRPGVRVDPGSHRPELPLQARHRDAARRRPRRSRSISPRSRRRASCWGRDAHAGAAQPGRPDECRALLAAGVDDFGGISPLTPDHVNPERPWPQIDALTELCADAASR